MSCSQENHQRVRELKPLASADIEQEKTIPLEFEILLNEAEGEG